MGYSILHIRLTLSFLVLFSFYGISQKDTVVYSPIEDFGRKQYGITQLESENELINVAYDNSDRSVSFLVYSKDSFTKIKEFLWIKQEEDFPEIKVFNVEYFAGSIIILYTYIDLSKSEKITAITAIDSNGSELKNIELDRYNWDRKAYDKNYFLSKTSSSTRLSICSTFPYRKNKDSEVNVYLLDQSLSYTLNKKLVLPGFEKISPPSQFSISQNGQLFFMSGQDGGKFERSERLGLEKRVYQLFKYDFENDKLKQYDVSIADKYISDVKMKLLPNQDLTVFGIYNRTFDKGAEGVFVMTIDGESGKINKSGKKKLDNRILEDFISGKKLDKNPVINDLYLDYFDVTSSGNIRFIGEVFFIDKRLINNTNGSNLTTSTYFNFEEILCVELDQNLNYVKHNTIFKRQKSTNFFSSYWSYSILQTKSDSGPILVYNYTKSRNENTINSVSDFSKTEVYLQGIFSTEVLKLEYNGKQKIAPGFNPELKNNYMILQDKNSYSMAQYVFGQ